MKKYKSTSAWLKTIIKAEEEGIKCMFCNDNGCPACDKLNKGSKYNPEPY